MASTEAGNVAIFSPSIWGDIFTSSSSDNQLNDSNTEEIEVLKEEARAMLLATGSKPAERLNLINTLERLGVSYHFEREIEEQLEQLFDDYNTNVQENEDYDLSSVAIHFRIFRQHGYKMPCHVFDKFRCSNGKFKKTLTSDVMGMLRLYEATYVRVHGEDVLDEALAFTAMHLESLVTQVSPFLAKQLSHALAQPLHKGMPIIETRHYISIYEEDVSKNETLLRFAKLDFNHVQKLHKQELSILSRWWNELNIASDLPYTRNRVVECYLFFQGAYFEPHYSNVRIMFTKIGKIMSVIDDTYDSYGTIKDLKVLRDLVQRWDIGAIDELPDYMKIIYRTLLTIFQEFDEEMTNQERPFAFHFLREAMKENTRDYYVEAKWSAKGYVPSFDEYMETAIITSGLHFFVVQSLSCLPEHATRETFASLRTYKAVIAAGTIFRLLDDIADYQVDKEKGNLNNAIGYYTKQFGVSVEEAIVELNKRVELAWRDINEELLRPFPISQHVLRRILSMCRSLDIFYKGHDGYNRPEINLKQHIYSLFVDPIPE